MYTSYLYLSLYWFIINNLKLEVWSLSQRISKVLRRVTRGEGHLHLLVPHITRQCRWRVLVTFPSPRPRTVWMVVTWCLLTRLCFRQGKTDYPEVVDPASSSSLSQYYWMLVVFGEHDGTRSHVCIFSVEQHCTISVHLQVAERVIQYVCGTYDQGITYCDLGAEVNNKLIGWVDSAESKLFFELDFVKGVHSHQRCRLHRPFLSHE